MSSATVTDLLPSVGNQIVADAELRLLATVLIDPSTADDILDRIKPDHFRHKRARLAFEGVQRLHAAGDEIGLPGLVLDLRQAGTLDAVGGAAWLSEILTDYPCGDPEDLCRQIIDAAEADRLAGVLHAGLKRLARQETPDEVAGYLRAAMDGDTNRQPDKAVVGISTLAETVVDEIEQLARDGGAQIKTPSGFRGIDEHLGGWKPGTLTILGARTGVGKSALALGFAIKAAGLGAPVLFISLEMSNRENTIRALAQLSGVSGGKIAHGRLGGDDWPKVVDAQKRLAGLPLAFADSLTTDVDIIAAIRRGARRDGVRLAIVDYLQLVRTIGKHERRDLELAQITRGLKALAMQSGIAVLALAQVNRESEKGADKRPTLAQLRESGSIEMDADHVLLLHRPEMTVQRFDDQGHQTAAYSSVKGKAELHIAKNRNGATGPIALCFGGPTFNFWEVPR